MKPDTTKLRNYNGYKANTTRAHFVHRRCAKYVAILALAGCAVPELPDVEIGLRNPTVTLAGSTRFDVSRFAGDWQTVQCLGQCAKMIRYTEATDGVFLRAANGVETPYIVEAPGVLREMGGAQRIVVMWVDEGFRTAAVGDADGRWAAVLDRGTGTPDRVKAATELLDFNGWDVSKMRKIDE